MCDLWVCELWAKQKRKGNTEGVISATSKTIDFGAEGATVEETAILNGEVIGTRRLKLTFKSLQVKQTMNEYYVEIDDRGEHSKPIKAVDFEEAAEMGAERDDSESAEYQCVNGTDVTVRVRHGETGEVKVFKVSGYSKACYDATEVRNECQ